MSDSKDNTLMYVLLGLSLFAVGTVVRDDSTLFGDAVDDFQKLLDEHFEHTGERHELDPRLKNGKFKRGHRDPFNTLRASAKRRREKNT